MTRLTSLCLAYQPRDHKGAEALDLVGSLGRYRHAGRCIPGMFFDLIYRNNRIESGALLQKAPARSNPMMEHSPGLWPRYACSGGQVHATGYGRSWIVLSPTPNPPNLPILIPLRCLGAGSARIFVATISCASGNAWALLFPHAVPIEKGRAIANFVGRL